MFRICFVLFLIHYQILSGVGSVKYALILENAAECKRPEPPYATKRIWISTFNIRRRKNTTLLSGQSKVLAEVPFTDFIATTYSVEAGQERRLIQVDKQDCRSWLGKLFLLAGNFRYSRKDCKVHTGTMGYRDIDLNKMFHTYPTWHSIGRFTHRIRLLFNGTTVFCTELFIWTRNIK